MCRKLHALLIEISNVSTPILFMTLVFSHLSEDFFFLQNLWIQFSDDSLIILSFNGHMNAVVFSVYNISY